MSKSMHEFRDALRRQLTLLWRRCRTFDEGNPDDALDMAARLRVIFHNTKYSTSLIAHLSGHHVQMLSTCSGRNLDPNCVLFEGLTFCKANVVGWKAALDDASCRRSIALKEWWEEEIVGKYGPGAEFTRKDIVLDTANKGHGVHVD
jgi:hypothetical protein